MFDRPFSRSSRARRIAGMVILGAAALATLGFLVMGLWNALLPNLFGLKPLHFWQALGLLALTRILFGGFHHGRCRGRHHRQRIIARWEHMTPEERERFRQGFRSRFCGGNRAERS